jgi:hypothetical protein
MTYFFNLHSDGTVNFISLSQWGLFECVLGKGKIKLV